MILNVCVGISSLYPPKKASQDKQIKVLWRKCKFATLNCLSGLLEHRKAE